MGILWWIDVILTAGATFGRQFPSHLIAPTPTRYMPVSAYRTAMIIRNICTFRMVGISGYLFTSIPMQDIYPVFGVKIAGRPSLYG